MNNFVLEAKGIEKVFNPGEDSEVKVLKGIDLKIKRGEFVAILGPSGSGKTTLLDILGCLLKPTKGNVFIDGLDVEELDESDLARMRGEKIGFIFQQYNLIQSSTALENVEIALRVNGKSKIFATKRAEELLKLVGLEKRMHHVPSKLSGGEQQRVAIARSLANDPSIILGDEPTGNLDTKTGDRVLKILKDLNKQKKYTLVLITHDPSVGKMANRIIRIKDGEIV